jgi:hypothetical protein
MADGITVDKNNLGNVSFALHPFKLSYLPNSPKLTHCKGKGTIHPITGHEGPEGE